MNVLTKRLTLFHDDCNFKVRFSTLDKEYYEKEWESMNMSCIPVKPPEFFCKNVDLGEVLQNLQGTYAQVLIENAGYKQPHEFILTGVSAKGAKNFLYFSSKFSNWPVKRIVIIENDKVIRNDFKKVYKLSWEDYKEGRYTSKKKSTPVKIKLRRPTLTQKTV